MLAFKRWPQIRTELEDSHVLLDSHLLIDDDCSLPPSVLNWDREILIDGIFQYPSLFRRIREGFKGGLSGIDLAR